MFDTKLTTIMLSGKEFPIKCDMFVLEQIQESYGDLAKFEDKLTKFVPDVDEDGNPVTNEDGLFVGKYVYPDLKAVSETLHLMVSEGLEIEGKEPINKKDLLRLVDANPIDIGNVLHEEYTKCFARKNVKTM